MNYYCKLNDFFKIALGLNSRQKKIKNFTGIDEQSSRS